MQAIVIVAIIFGCITTVIIMPVIMRTGERRALHNTLRAAIDKGQPLPPEIIESLSAGVQVRPKPSAARDLRVGIIWVGVAIGIAALGIALSYDEPDATYPLFGVAAFPGFIGLAFIVISFLARGKDA